MTNDVVYSHRVQNIRHSERGRQMTENSRIRNLYGYLMKTKADSIIVRTTLVSGGWNDNEFDANAAGFSICRFRNPEYEARHEFAECYRLIRK